jgi:hypothetical protein
MNNSFKFTVTSIAKLKHHILIHKSKLIKYLLKYAFSINIEYNYYKNIISYNVK